MEKVGDRELCGISDANSGMAIDMKLIKRFSNNEFFIGEGYNRPKYIGVFVDPNAGGSSSLGIISVAIINGGLVVCFILISFFLQIFYSWICFVDDSHQPYATYVDKFIQRDFGDYIIIKLLDIQNTI